MIVNLFKEQGGGRSRPPTDHSNKKLLSKPYHRSDSHAFFITVMMVELDIDDAPLNVPCNVFHRSFSSFTYPVSKVFLITDGYSMIFTKDINLRTFL